MLLTDCCLRLCSKTEDSSPPKTGVQREGVGIAAPPALCAPWYSGALLAVPAARSQGDKSTHELPGPGVQLTEAAPAADFPAAGRGGGGGGRGPPNHGCSFRRCT
jgi:hypothetical protein